MNVFGDLFADFFGATANQATLSLQDACAGCRREVRVARTYRCEACGDAGHEPGVTCPPCQRCDGRGRVVNDDGMVHVLTTCPGCEGRGIIVLRPCKACQGRGGVRSEETVELEIPPGTRDGTVLRLPEVGDPSAAGKAEALIRVSIEPHPTLRVVGDDLRCEVALEPSLAASGGEVEVDTLTGRRSVTVPAGTRDGDNVRLRGYGPPRPHAAAVPLPSDGVGYRAPDLSERGDQLVVFRIPASRPRKSATTVRLLATLALFFLAVLFVIAR